MENELGASIAAGAICQKWNDRIYPHTRQGATFFALDDELETRNTKPFLLFLLLGKD